MPKSLACRSSAHMAIPTRSGGRRMRLLAMRPNCFCIPIITSCACYIRKVFRLRRWASVTPMQTHAKAGGCSPNAIICSGERPRVCGSTGSLPKALAWMFCCRPTRQTIIMTRLPQSSKPVPSGRGHCLSVIILRLSPQPRTHSTICATIKRYATAAGPVVS